MCPKTQEEEKKNSKVPYSSPIGRLMYAMLCTRPYISHEVGVVSRYMSHLGLEHWNVIKWILQYLRGTSNKYLHFRGSTNDFQSYVDSDLIGDIDTMWSTTGYIFTIGGVVVSWVFWLKKINTLSTTEGEYGVATKVAKEIIWIQFFMEESGHP